MSVEFVLARGIAASNTKHLSNNIDEILKNTDKHSEEQLRNAFKYISDDFYINQIEDVPCTRKVCLVSDPNSKLTQETAIKLDDSYRLKSQMFYIPNREASTGYTTRFLIHCNISDVCDIIGTLDIYHTVKVSELTEPSQIELWLPNYVLLTTLPNEMLAGNVFNSIIK